MNTKIFNSLLLGAICLTLIAIVAVDFLPKRQLIYSDTQNIKAFLHWAQLDNGAQTAEWIDQKKLQWRCNYPEHYSGDYFPCSVIIELGETKFKGIDLSKFNDIKIHLHYKGSANKIRMALRNFDRHYSIEADDNSSKFNSIHIHTRELNRLIRLSLSDFSVSEWWLEKYNIPLEQSSLDLHNATQLTIDFSEQLKPGLHEFAIDTLIFEGNWISAAHWYLGILISWMIAISIIAMTRLIRLYRQTLKDIEIINELSNTNQKLVSETNTFRRLSTVDALTQAYNRFGIDQIVNDMVARSTQIQLDHQPLCSLILFDIDHFKRVNDERGHDAGDRVLGEVARIAHQLISEHEFFGRWGGEEFLIIAPRLALEEAQQLAENLRASIAAHVFEPDDPLVVTVSLGVGGFYAEEDFASAFKRLDKALYTAKKNGRNQSVLAS